MIKHVGDKTNFRCASISSTYPSQSVGWSVRNTFVFPFCQRLWAHTKRDNIVVAGIEVDTILTRFHNFTKFHNPESWSQGLVDWVQTFSTRSLNPAWAFSKLRTFINRWFQASLNFAYVFMNTPSCEDFCWDQDPPRLSTKAWLSAKTVGKQRCKKMGRVPNHEEHTGFGPGGGRTKTTLICQCTQRPAA